jgi:hypothetical protein
MKEDNVFLDLIELGEESLFCLENMNKRKITTKFLKTKQNPTKMHKNLHLPRFCVIFCRKTEQRGEVRGKR